MDTDRTAGRARIVALMAEQGPGGHEQFISPRRNLRDDVRRLTQRVGHVGVIRPNLARRIQRVIRMADDDRTLPIRLAGEVALVSGDDGRDVEAAGAKDVESLMAVTGAERVAPAVTEEAIGGEEEGRAGATVAGGQGQFGMRGRVGEPLAKAIRASRAGE